ncbi:FKBP-type peptidyl-prolyl cis-trans isomerase [Pseudoluteimonas lycopersici]|uniref:Peptidyl-prolyl cis-trans isomerase n=1 Tax=Pseudoluteimonas lycopersici TaxID=1324796 RepID=A0A516V2Q9_9GAMM|nr:FKBP-type peptidyl-prolyl cis-trans isomerase [Lysobacter lycopersici]QDQ72811.1 FKBP-type peptidyl-prolyl cis-trans isomerase [Lysobacter lycopersici]
MKSKSRSMLAVLLLAALAAAGCNKADKPAADAAKKTDATAAKGDQIAGLPTEKDQVSYMIGMQMGKSLEPVKDDVDVDVIAKAIKDSVTGGKLLLTEEQAQKIGESFSEKMQAKQIADMMAKGKKNATEGAAFLAANGKKPNVKTTATGLQYEVITEGKGAKPKPTDVVKVNYKGSLLDGTEFDGSEQHGGPATMPLAQVVPGWREGITLMPVGSKYRFWIPAALGFGEQGTPGGPIPPSATLVFEVELLDIAKGGKPPMPQAH